MMEIFTATAIVWLGYVIREAADRIAQAIESIEHEESDG